MQPFSLLVKPAGSDCNLDCSYCFYKDRAPQIGTGRQRMTEKVLEKMTKDYLQLGFERPAFAWQGGEPMLMGLDFYKRAVELQKQYKGPKQKVENALQTNAILIDESWGQFLHDNNFLVGISIDGPKELHDYYRKDHCGSGSFDKVMKAIEVCKKFRAEFNTLTLINDKTADCSDEIFDFLTSLGTNFLQFIPCVEKDPETGKITDFSVKPQRFADFFCRIFDRWKDYGPEKLRIRDFDSILSFCSAGRHTMCTYDTRCSGYIVVEHTGDCYPCDFFVEPKWHLGNIFETPVGKIAAGSKKREFVRSKQNLCNKCLVCRHLDLCRGGCLKDRRIGAEDNFNKPSELCEGYKKFFDYAMPGFVQIAAKFCLSPSISAQTRQLL
jgi:uncharacterized protein